MNPRERTLAFALLGAIVLAGGGFLFYSFFWKPLRGRNAVLADLQKRVAAREQQVADMRAKKEQIERWRALSLPGDLHMAWGEYQKYLNEQIRESGFSPGAMSVKSRVPTAATAGTGRTAKKPPFTPLSYELSGFGKLESLVKLLERIYRTPLLHQVKAVDIKKPDTARPGQGPDELDITLKVEAVIVEGAPKRATLIPQENVPEVKVLAEKPRRYADIAGKNIFLGPPPASQVQSVNVYEVTRRVHLVDITHNETKVEAFLYDVYNNRKVRLRATSGFDTFRVADNHDETMVRGKVVRIEERDLIFVADEKYYRLHMDESIHDAMRKPLSEAEVKELKLVTASK